MFTLVWVMFPEQEQTKPFLNVHGHRGLVHLVPDSVVEQKFLKVKNKFDKRNDAFIFLKNSN